MARSWTIEKCTAKIHGAKIEGTSAWCCLDIAVSRGGARSGQTAARLSSGVRACVAHLHTRAPFLPPPVSIHAASAQNGCACASPPSPPLTFYFSDTQFSRSYPPTSQYASTTFTSSAHSSASSIHSALDRAGRTLPQIERMNERRQIKGHKVPRHPRSVTERMRAHTIALTEPACAHTSLDRTRVRTHQPGLHSPEQQMLHVLSSQCHPSHRHACNRPTKRRMITSEAWHWVPVPRAPK